jgi:hypothetical protein
MCLGAVIQTGAIDRREDGAFPTAISHQTPDQICSFVNELSRGGGGSVHRGTGCSTFQVVDFVYCGEMNALGDVGSISNLKILRYYFDIPSISR